MSGTGPSNERHDTLSEDVRWARLAVSAALGVRGVVALGAGEGAEVATYGPETRVQGVRLTRILGRIDLDLHLVAELARSDEEGLDLFQLAETVREAIVTAFAGNDGMQGLRLGSIHITFDDVRPPEARRS